jgi:hypothetical protein
MDFIVSLPKEDGFSSILVVVDRFSKYATFIPATKESPAEKTAELFVKHIVKYWGVPRTIVSDRDARFTGKFWREVFRLLGSDLLFSTSFHPQTDGQTERVNALLEQYLRHYVSANQKNWVKLLDVAQFCYNLQKSESSGHSPFEIATGQQPLMPHTLAAQEKGRPAFAYQFVRDWQEQTDLAKAFLHKAAHKMKKWADQNRRHVEFRQGDQVLVKLYPNRTDGSYKGRHQALIRKYEGPFMVVKRVGKLAYKLDLPPEFRVHPVFHVCNLKPFHADEEDPSRNAQQRELVLQRAPANRRAADRQLEEILRHKVNYLGEPKKYLVRWIGEEDPTWEYAFRMKSRYPDKVSAYHATDSAEDVARF